MESNQILSGLRERSAEAQQAPIALAEGLQALAGTFDQVESSVRSLVCPLCWAASGRACTITRPAGDHLARWIEADQRGVISRDELKAVIAGLDVIAAHVIVRDGAR